MNRTFATFISILVLSAAAFAATVTVTKVEDTFDFVCDSDCSLRDAVSNAGINGTVVFATPLFNTPQTISVNGEITLYGTFTIVGPGTNLLTIRNVAPQSYTSRVFVIAEDSDITMTGFTISGGRTFLSEPGAGIINRNRLTLNGMNLTDNQTSDRGGAVHNAGTGILNIQNSTISGNSSTGSGGGGLSNLGTASVTNTQFNNNTAGFGGSIVNGGILSLTASTVSGNTVTGSGGGIANNGTLTIGDSSVSGNSANDASNASRQAGGIFNNGNLTISGSTIANNISRYGGGINNDPGGSVQIVNSTVSGNNSDGGGGLQNLGSATIIGSTFFNNYGTEGGAIGNFSQLNIANSTLSGNSANGNRGGAIYNQSSITLNGVTIAANTALSGGGIFNNGGTVTSKSSIISGNTAIAQCPEYRGPLVSQGFNLVNDPTLCVQISGGPSDIIGVDARLAPLGNYGGPTMTQALCTGVGVPHSSCPGPSPALDKGGAPSVPLSTDQRGLSARTIDNPLIPNAGDGTDIGAFESHLFLTVTKTADSNDGVCDSDCSLREAIAVADAGDTIQFRPPSQDTPQSFAVNGQITLNKNLTIVGNGANLTTLRNVAAPGATSRLFAITGGTVNISKITLSGGRLNAPSSALPGCSQVCGGALFVTTAGGLTLNETVVSDNQANAPGSINAGGGAIYSLGTLTIRNSLIHGNQATSAVATNGGALSYDGTVVVENSTFSNNSATGASTFGGAVYQAGGVAIVMQNTTVVNNSVTSTNFCSGGGVAANASARNSLFANNTLSCQTQGAKDISNLNSFGNNLIGDANGTFISGTTTGNILNQNPRVAPLGFYGGPTMSHALMSGSPALNAGNNCVTNLTCASNNPTAALSTDQRGAARVGTVDIGAFEANNTSNGGAYRAPLLSGSVNTPYNLTLVPSSGSTSFAVTAGALPPGMSLTTAFAPAATVALTGTPTTGGAYNFSITATSGASSYVTDYRVNIVTPTAAGVEVSGRVMTAKGAGLVNATVTLTDATGVVRTARTTSFGNFRFDDVAAGQTYVVNVVAKRASFAPQVVYVGDSVSGLEFIEGGGGN